MEYNLSKRLSAVVLQAENDWSNIQHDFNDEKAREFEQKMFHPLLEEVKNSVRWMSELEIALQEADRHMGIPIP